MLRLTIQNQDDEIVVETSRYLFELPTCYEKSSLIIKQSVFPVQGVATNVASRAAAK